MTALVCGAALQFLPLAQAESAVDLATREWTLAGFAIFILIVVCGFFMWLLRSLMKRRDDEVQALVEARNEREAGWRADLQAQIASRSKDADRLAEGLASAAAATRDQARATEALGSRIAALEERVETVDRCTDTMSKILDRREKSRDD